MFQHTPVYNASHPLRDGERVQQSYTGPVDGPPTITLAIETSNTPTHERERSDIGPGVTIVRGVDPAELKVLDRADLSRRTSHDDALVSAVDRCVSDAGVAIADVGRIAVSVGPGGYTSLRIAVTVAKSLAFVTGAECVAVPTSLGVAHSARDRLTPETRSVVCLAWKRGDVWCRFFEGAHPTEPGAIRSIESIAETDADLFLAEQPVIERLSAQNPGIADRATSPIFDPVSIATRSFELPAVDPAALRPLYPREPEAVRLDDAQRSRV